VLIARNNLMTSLSLITAPTSSSLAVAGAPRRSAPPVRSALLFGQTPVL
jgi:hypothetical protein